MWSPIDGELQKDICRTIQQEYSACDVSDALLKLGVPAAGFLTNIAPLLGIRRAPRRLVAPVSTAVLVPKSWSEDADSPFPSHIPSKSNIPPGQNWTDCPAPGTIVLVQQPRHHISAILGDIMVVRLKTRGVLGAVVDGRVRDTRSCAAVCSESPAHFQVWSRGLSAAAPSLEAKPWAVDVPLKIGDLWTKPGDILCADEEDGLMTVIPQEQLRAVFDMLPILKKASDEVMEDVRNGLSLPEAVKRHPNFYSNYK